MQIQILKINGTAKELYPLVGPLVMNPEVLKYNNRYPFKTGKNFEWYIAVNEADDETVGFIPLEYKSHETSINNYYVQQEGHNEILNRLIEVVWQNMTKDMPQLTALVQTRHAALFKEQGFTTTKEWKLYLKMQKTK